MGKRFIIAVGIATILVYVWGFIAYLAIPVNSHIMRPFEHKQEVVDVLDKATFGDGIYVYPNRYHMKEKPDHFPLVFVNYVEHGEAFFGVQPYFASIAISFAIALFLALLALMTNIHSVVGKIVMLTFVGFIGSFATLLPGLNWMGLNFAYVLFEVVNQTIVFFLASIPISLILRKPPIGHHV